LTPDSGTDRAAARDVGGDGGQPQLRRGLVAGVAEDDHPLLIDDDQLAEAELPYGVRHGANRRVVDPRIVLARPDRLDGVQLDVHVALLCSGMPGLSFSST
jgi:hypothetical protein